MFINHCTFHFFLLPFHFRSVFGRSPLVRSVRYAPSDTTIELSVMYSVCDLRRPDFLAEQRRDQSLDEQRRRLRVTITVSMNKVYMHEVIGMFHCVYVCVWTNENVL